MYVPHSPIPSSAHSLADYAQRTRLLSLYAQGCILDTQGWYSITPESIAHQIAYRCSLLTSTNTNTRMKEGRVNLTILDPFCGVGGNVLAFASVFERGQSSSSYHPSFILHPSSYHPSPLAPRHPLPPLPSPQLLNQQQ